MEYFQSEFSRLLLSRRKWIMLIEDNYGLYIRKDPNFSHVEPNDFFDNQNVNFDQFSQYSTQNLIRNRVPRLPCEYPESAHITSHDFIEHIAVRTDWGT